MPKYIKTLGAIERYMLSSPFTLLTSYMRGGVSFSPCEPTKAAGVPDWQGAPPKKKQSDSHIAVSQNWGVHFKGVQSSFKGV